MPNGGFAPGEFWVCRLYLAVSILMFAGRVVGLSDVMFPFGTGESDIFLPRSTEYATEKIALSQTFCLLDKNYDSLFVGVSGIISFREAIPVFSTQPLSSHDVPFIAPYWADVDTRDYGAVSYRQLRWTDVGTDGLFERVNGVIRTTFIDQDGFSASWMFIASWYKVGFNGQIGSGTVNTFQCVLLSGDGFSGVIFNYDTLKWDSDIFHGANAFTGIGGVPAQVGFSAGDRKHGYALDVSQLPDVINMTEQSNVNVPGRFVFRVGLPEIEDPSCTSEGFVRLFPSIGPLLGRNKILIQGPCFNNLTDVVVCKFHDIFSRGTVESALRASCIVPTLLKDGEIAVDVSLDGGVSFPYTGYYYLEPLSETGDHARVYRYNAEDWLTSGDLDVSWDVSALDDVSSVKVVVYSYSLGANGSVSWKPLKILAQGLSYDEGGANLVKPIEDVALDGKDDNYDDAKLMGAIAVVEELEDDDDTNRIPQAIWSDLHSLEWLFPHNSASWCYQWSANEILDLDYLSTRPPCPCVLRQARQDYARYREIVRQANDDQTWSSFPPTFSNADNPFRCFVSTQISYDGTGQECCYNEGGVLLEDRFTASGFGSTRQYAQAHAHTTETDYDDDVIGHAAYLAHFYYDVIPGMQCCAFTKMDPEISEQEANESCARYLSLRPSQSCKQYEVPKPASVFGAGHITTFDGLAYTIHNQGEYTLLDSEDKRIVMQGRFETIKTTEDSSTTPGPILTAIAIKQNSSDTTFHIQPSPCRDLSVFAQRGNGPFSLVDSTQSHSWKFNGVGLFYYSDIPRDGIQLVFDQGVGLRVKVTGSSLRFIVIIPPELKNKTRGLLCSWNDRVDDDYELNNGTVLPLNASTGDISQYFGMSWSVQKGESLLYYLPGYSPEAYPPDTLPTVPVDPKPEVEGALGVCNGDDLCAADVIAGRSDEDFALATLAAQEELQTTIDDLAEVDKSYLLCPEVNAPVDGSLDSATGRDVGDKIAFLCEKCYDLVGDPVVTCQYDLRWSGQVPMCKRGGDTTCISPKTPQNCDVTIAECNRAASFVCHEGFDLIGREVITCLNGTWSHEAPRCVAAAAVTPTMNAQRVLSDADGDHVIENSRTSSLSGTPVITERPQGVQIERISQKSSAMWWVYVVFIAVIIVALLVVIGFLCFCLREKLSGNPPSSPTNKGAYDLIPTKA